MDLHRAAAELYRRHDRLRDAARATTRQANALRGHPEQSRTLLREALRVLAVDPDAAAVNALEILASLEYAVGNLEEGDQLVTKALTLAQALDLPDATLSELFSTGANGHLRANRPAQAVAYLREAIRRAENADDSGAISRAMLNLADSLLTSDPPGAVGVARSGIAHAHRVGDFALLSNGACNMMQALLLTGEWDEIEREYTAISGEGGAEGPAVAYSVVLLRALRADPALEAVLPVLSPWADSGDAQDHAEATTAFAAAAASVGNAAEALSLAGQALAHADTLGPRSDGIRWAWALAADAALALDDSSEADRLLDWLNDYPPGHLPPVLRAEGLRIRARRLAAEGSPETGPAFDAAVKAFRGLGSPYHLAVCLLDYAEHLTAVGDIETAGPLALEAQAIAQRLHARPLLNRAQHLVGSASADRSSIDSMVRTADPAREVTAN